jgi:hypothetical protein
MSNEKSYKGSCFCGAVPDCLTDLLKALKSRYEFSLFETLVSASQLTHSLV